MSSRSKNFELRAQLIRAALELEKVNPLAGMGGGFQKDEAEPLEIPQEGTVGERLEALFRQTVFMFGSKVSSLLESEGFELFGQLLRSAIRPSAVDIELSATTFNIWLLTEMVPVGEKEPLIEYLIEANRGDAAVRLLEALRDANRWLLRIDDVAGDVASAVEVVTGKKFKIHRTASYMVKAGDLVFGRVVRLAQSKPGSFIGRVWNVAPERQDEWIAAFQGRAKASGFASGEDLYRQWLRQGDHPLYWLAHDRANAFPAHESVSLAHISDPPVPAAS